MDRNLRKTRVGIVTSDKMDKTVVVTIKEVKGINRIDEFIKNFQLESWLVNRIDVKARIDINETIEFE